MKSVVVFTILLTCVLWRPTASSLDDSRTLDDADRRLQTTTEVAFETIERGQHSGVEYSVAHSFLSRTCFCRFWSEHVSNRFPKPDCPTVDFDEETVIAVFRGTEYSGGYDATITTVEDMTGTGRLAARYETTDPPPGALVTAVLTQPYHIVRAKKGSTEPACFSRADDDDEIDVVATDSGGISTTTTAAYDVAPDQEYEERLRREGRIRQRRPPRRSLVSEPICEKPSPLPSEEDGKDDDERTKSLLSKVRIRRGYDDENEPPPPTTTTMSTCPKRNRRKR